MSATHFVIVREEMDRFRDRHPDQDGKETVGNHIEWNAARGHGPEGGRRRAEHDQIR